MMRRGLVLASYGTTRQDARRRDIEPLARELCAAAPGVPFCEAYLSAPVRRMLRRKGADAPGALGDALAALADAGVERACVQPALIVAGSTLEALLAEASGWEGAFPGGIVVGEPLLSSARDLHDVARAIPRRAPCAREASRLPRVRLRLPRASPALRSCRGRRPPRGRGGSACAARRPAWATRSCRCLAWAPAPSLARAVREQFLTVSCGGRAASASHGGGRAPARAGARGPRGRASWTGCAPPTCVNTNRAVVVSSKG